MTATQEREVVGRAMWFVMSCCDCSHRRSDELDDYDGRDGPVLDETMVPESDSDGARGAEGGERWRRGG